MRRDDGSKERSGSLGETDTPPSPKPLLIARALADPAKATALAARAQTNLPLLSE